MLIIFCVDELTYWSLMSNVVILCWSLIGMLLSSCATSLDFFGSMCVCMCVCVWVGVCVGGWVVNLLICQVF